MGQVGTSWDKLGRVGTSWEPKKLQNLDIKKNVSRKKEERRKKKNIGYRVASNERRLIKIFL